MGTAAPANWGAAASGAGAQERARARAWIAAMQGGESALHPQTMHRESGCPSLAESLRGSLQAAPCPLLPAPPVLMASWGAGRAGAERTKVAAAFV